MEITKQLPKAKSGTPYDFKAQMVANREKEKDRLVEAEHKERLEQDALKLVLANDELIDVVVGYWAAQQPPTPEAPSRSALQSTYLAYKVARAATDIGGLFEADDPE